MRGHHEISFCSKHNSRSLSLAGIQHITVIDDFWCQCKQFPTTVSAFNCFRLPHNEGYFANVLSQAVPKERPDASLLKYQAGSGILCRLVFERLG